MGNRWRRKNSLKFKKACFHCLLLDFDSALGHYTLVGPGLAVSPMKDMLCRDQGFAVELLWEGIVVELHVLFDSGVDCINRSVRTVGMLQSHHNRCIGDALCSQAGLVRACPWVRCHAARRQ